MAAPTTTAPGNNLGFLTILQEPSGTLGGYLVTNLWGRPLEFRLTNAVQPNRVQHILYGDTLSNYLCGELIGKTLVDKSTTPATWIITDHVAALDLRLRVSVPVSVWVPGGPPPVLPGDPQGQGLYGHERFPEDGAVVHALLGKLGNLDLGEPFQRIRDAIHEARKMGVGKTAAARPRLYNGFMSSYLQTVEDVYADAARQPDQTLCCTSAPVWRLPDLTIPAAMLAMNYGCGSTVDPRDLRPGDTILYVGVGGGLEALQFAYCTRRPGGVIAVDPVAAMRAKAEENFREAARLNSWFRPDFIDLRDGNALHLPVADGSVSVAAQNCLFNVFKEDDLERALGEIIRVLKPGGFFATSDPITPTPLPEAFRADEVARARCLSGCETFENYLAALTGAGFGRIDVRARFPYRYLTPHEYAAIVEPVMLESVEIVAYKVPDGPDGPEIFTGRTATYAGPAESFTADQGQVLPCGVPMPVSDAAARRLAARRDIVLTPPTYRTRAGGCC